MDSIKKMIENVEEKYHISLRENQCFDYTCNELRKEYDISGCSDEEGTLKLLVLDIVLGSIIVKEETDIVEYYGMKIRKMLREYEENKGKLRTYYDDNDMEQIEGIIDRINACKDKMYPVKRMITDMKEMYDMYLREDRGIKYVFIRLWDEYDTWHCPNEEIMLKILVFDIIIASMNIKEDTSIVASFGIEIRRMMSEYEESKEKLPIYYDDNDMKLIEDMIDQINACK